MFLLVSKEHETVAITKTKMLTNKLFLLSNSSDVVFYHTTICSNEYDNFHAKLGMKKNVFNLWVW